MDSVYRSQAVRFFNALNVPAPVSALSLYAATKINVENALMKKYPKLPCTVLRFATIYGLACRVRFDLLVHEFIRDAWTDKCVEIYGPDGWRPFLHVDDAARAVVMVCEQSTTVGHKEIFNVGLLVMVPE